MRQEQGEGGVVEPAMCDDLRALGDVGYAVVPAILPEDARARLLVAFEDAPLQDGGTQHVRVGDDTAHADAWRSLARHPLVEAAAARILGRPFRLRDVHGRNPLRGYGQQGLHTDWKPRAVGAPPVVVTLLWMLDDFTRENGATRVVPGSHTWTKPLPKALAQPLAHHPSEIVVSGRAGSVLVFDGHLLHSGRRNESGAPRRTVQMVLQALT
ncbi:MAG: phytanoyl-CoA dioxygenase family protein [Polyangiaceae bacterium]